MHARIQQRRESVGARAFARDDATEINSLQRMMGAIESKALAIEAALRDERILALMPAIRSARLIVEMSAGGDDVAKQLIPCVPAVLLHVRSVMVVLGEEIAARDMDNHVIPKPRHSNAIPVEQLA
ncbi:MAG: hypothetical protein ABMA14_16245 [Hyphomonadaceae bacterium]